MIFPQGLLDFHDELIVDLFAGGGGASSGIEAATGRQVDVAVNHDQEAVAMHRVNHPHTEHYRKGISEVCPYEATGGRPVGLLWASPDCTFHSKARGGRPIRSSDEQQRALAWVVTRWAGQVRPRVIMLENVEEFVDWGPLVAKRCKETGRVLKDVPYTDEKGRERTRTEVAAPGERVPIEQQQLVPDKARAGERFEAWAAKMERHGYEVEWRELSACDFGAPTTRTRFFVIARRDGEPIRWPEPTHAPRGSAAVRAKRKKPYRSAASCIDWERPMASIFLTPEEAQAWKKKHGKARAPKRPLAENTMRRIARGFMRYVVEADEPFVVPETEKLSFISSYYGGERRGAERGAQLMQPLRTQPTQNRHALVTAQVQAYYGSERGGDGAAGPLRTQTAKARHAVVTAFLTQNYGGFYTGDGRSMRSPMSTITKSGSHRSVVAANLLKLRGTSTAADAAAPLHTISAGGNHHAVVAGHLMTNTSGHSGARLESPCPTVTTGGHHALVASLLEKYCGDRAGASGCLSPEGFVTVDVNGQAYVVADIYLRMLQPRECYRANGFHDGHRIHYGTDADGERVRFTKGAKMRMVGNSVPPQFVEALVRVNAPELAARPALAMAA